jgi:tRNA(Leu) C34 or U34 (ribose-2'-O)-methylase TrmL
VRGFASIGLVRPKCHENVGSVLRASFCYDVSMVAIEGDRSGFVRSRLDPGRAFRHLPVVHGEDLKTLIPYGAVPVAVDLVDDAVSLFAYQHPQQAFYVFGPENGTLGKQHLSWCRDRVMIPTKMCMNLAATVNVILYDRMAKADRYARHIKYSKLEQVA